MGLPQRKVPIDAQEYLRAERESVERHAFYAGEVFAIAGGTGDHSAIVTNVLSELRVRLKGKPCRPYESNLRIRVPATNLYTYPDATVICGERKADPDDKHGETFVNPALIVEVLSPSSEVYDRGAKFTSYQRIETLREYVLVSQDRPMVECFVRQDNGRWEYLSVTGIDAVARLASLRIDLPLAEVYDGVTFAPEDPPAAVRPE